MSRSTAFIGAAVLASIAVAMPARRDVHGLALVVRAADLQGFGRRLADLDATDFEERLVRIPTRAGSVPGRVYAPRSAARHTVLLVTGLHPAGVDEPRLVSLARKLAEAKLTV